MSQKETRPVWAEINLDNLAHNIKEVRRITRKESLVTAVVKADAYGHGAAIVANTFLKNGADRLAVATLSEAIELRNSNIEAPILILGYTPEYQSKALVEHNIISAVYKYEQAKAISDEAIKLQKTAKVHVKVDTGMSRIGYLPNEDSADEILKMSNLPNLEIEGLFTHFALADDEDKTTTKIQFERFQWMVSELEKRGIKIPIKHVSNSAAIIDLPEYNMDMVRAGIILYGLYPSEDVHKSRIDLKPAMTLKAKISHVKEIEENTGISYGHIYVTDSKTKIGTVPIGYADGYTRLLSNKVEGAINGIRVPNVGRICMDQCMFDITNIEKVSPGDEILLFGDGSKNEPHIDEIASMLGTINYEIVCMISKRVPRVYKEANEIVYIRDYILK
ncbi:alanine racemase [Clostridiisalibacter paucivorans]|uniref:alanine racemase n=1 Tax=Clostridiisalibacter paucivorans TaxID=408753 RepID=UPI000478ABD4|nr:alanine racemase [Clostridiisalibacter paucivorans]